MLMGLSLMLITGLEGVQVAVPNSPVILGLLLAREVLIGAALGFAMRMIETVAQIAGSFAGISMGLSLNVFVDPTTGDQSIALGSLLAIGTALLFVIMGGHHIFLLAMFEHFKVVPVGQLTYAAPSAEVLGGMIGHISFVGLRLAAPVLISTLVMNVALGFIGRTVTSVNIFGIGLGMLMMVGFLSLGTQPDALRVWVDTALHALPETMFRMTGDIKVTP